MFLLQKRKREKDQRSKIKEKSEAHETGGKRETQGYGAYACLIITSVPLGLSTSFKRFSVSSRISRLTFLSSCRLYLHISTAFPSGTYIRENYIQYICKVCMCHVVQENLDF